MKQKATYPFLAADKVLCIVNIKATFVLALLQRKVLVFFSMSPSTLSGLLCQFSGLISDWGKEGEALSCPTFMLSQDQKFSKSIRTYGTPRVLWTCWEQGLRRKKACRVCGANTAQHSDASKIIFLQRTQTLAFGSCNTDRLIKTWEVKSHVRLPQNSCLQAKMSSHLETTKVKNETSLP